MEMGGYYYLQQNHQQQQQQQSCGLAQYLSDHANGTTTTTGFDKYADFESASSSEMETYFMLSGNGSSDNVSDMQEKAVKQEEMYQIQSLTSFSDEGLENSMQVPKLGNGNCSNLVMQSSSPAQFFSNQGLDNGFNTLRVSKGEPTSTTTRLYNNHISFSSGPSSYSKPPPQITENGSSNGNFITDARHNASLSGLKRARETDADLFRGLNKLQTQNRDRSDGSTGLAHHMSLPKTYEETDVVDKYLQFEGSVPCKIRAKRGFATHPRSIAERVRRTRISARIRKLQGLFPNIDKQTNTADMLDMAVECIKDLQKQVKVCPVDTDRVASIERCPCPTVPHIAPPCPAAAWPAPQCSTSAWPALQYSAAPWPAPKCPAAPWPAPKGPAAPWPAPKGPAAP